MSDAIGIVDYSRGADAISIMKPVGVGTDARPYSITANAAGDRAFVANTQAGYMCLIDIANGNELERIMVGYGGRAITLSADEKYAFISVEPDNEIAVIDLSQNKVVHRVTVEASPRGIALDKDTNELYVADFDRSHSPAGTRNALSIVDVSDPLNAKTRGRG